jgi:hypothetical protein
VSVLCLTLHRLEEAYANTLHKTRTRKLKRFAQMMTAKSRGTAHKDVRNQLDVYVNANNASENLQAPWFIGTRFIIVYFIILIFHFVH